MIGLKHSGKSTTRRTELIWNIINSPCRITIWQAGSWLAGLTWTDRKGREINSIHQTFIKVKEDRNYLYGKIKLLTVNFQVVSSISCYNFNLNGFREKISRNAKFVQTFFQEISLYFRIFCFVHFREKCEVSRKCLQNTNENVCIFSKKVSFARIPIYIGVGIF